MTTQEKLNDAVEYMEAIAACPEHGYNQAARMGVDYDCSSLVCRGLSHAGFDITPSLSTHSMYPALLKIGFKTIKNPGKGKFKRGDVLLTPGAHVAVMVDESRLVHAVSDERGKARGGKPGDQTGKEILIQDYYARSGGWKYVMRLQIPLEKLSLEEIAKEVIAGKWGAGNARRDKLVNAGYNYTKVQAKVNEILKGGKS